MRIVWKLLHRRRSLRRRRSYVSEPSTLFVIGNLDRNLPINLNEIGSPKMVKWNAKSRLIRKSFFFIYSLGRFYVFWTKYLSSIQTGQLDVLQLIQMCIPTLCFPILKYYSTLSIQLDWDETSDTLKATYQLTLFELNSAQGMSYKTFQLSDYFAVDNLIRAFHRNGEK